MQRILVSGYKYIVKKYGLAFFFCSFDDENLTNEKQYNILAFGSRYIGMKTPIYSLLHICE